MLISLDLNVTNLFDVVFYLLIINFLYFIFLCFIHQCLEYIFTQPLRHEQYATQGHFLKKSRACFNRAISLMSKVFANGPEDRGSIPGQVIPKTQKNST